MTHKTPHDNSMKALWDACQSWLAQGLSIFPVRLKTKAPVNDWGKYRSQLITREELWDLMSSIREPAIAVACGRGSGNLECIDLDVKNYPTGGGEGVFLGAIMTLFPEIYPKLRIHRTQSGGYHIYYRVEGGAVTGNQKLAVAEGMKGAWIETRGEGGYALLPPSPGYEVIQDVPISVLSMDERNSLINLAKSYDTRVKIERKERIAKKESSFYDTNPWEDFAQSPAGEEVLRAHGWEFYRENASYIYFTRPGKDRGISASFNRTKRVYYVFSSSTELDPEKGYTPGTLMAILDHGGDMKAAYRYLVDQGYGKIRKDVEERIIETSALNNAPLPGNVSEEGKQLFEVVAKEVHEKYPHGVFWKGDVIQGYSISRQALYRVAESMGFCLYEEANMCRVIGHTIHPATKRDLFEALKAYVKEEQDIIDHILDSYESFLQNAGAFTISRLPLLESKRIVKSMRYKSFKYFRNGYLEITANEIKLRPYSDLGDGLIWEDQIQDRDFRFMPSFREGLYAEFLRLALVDETMARPAIGYLAHEYKDASMAYILVLCEAVPDPKDGGGSGKNIFTSLFKGTTTVKDIPGAQVQLNEKFYQPWCGERVYSLSDLPKRFDFSFLKNLSSGDAVIKKLFKDEETISVERLPKIVLSTNYSYEVSDGGLRRRIIPIEFTDFFTRAGGVDVYFDDKLFPLDWSDDDWSEYDNYIAHCIQLYLRQPKLVRPELTEGGWIKQFKTNFGELTYNFIEEYVETWKTKKIVPLEEFNEMYDRFCRENGVQLKYKLTSIRMNMALEEYCQKHEIKFQKDYRTRINSIRVRCKLFGDEETQNSSAFQAQNIFEMKPLDDEDPPF